jgi:hypothetical protein
MSVAPVGPNEHEALVNARKRIFLLLLNRLRDLHANRPIPESYYAGKEYVEDKIRVDATIVAHFMCPGYVKPFEFWLHGIKVDGKQYGNILRIEAHRKISVKLWDHLRLMGVGQQFIIGYLKALMPSINRHLIENRYREGHLLSRTFAIFEAMQVGVIVRSQVLQIAWPRGISSFPPSAQLSEGNTNLYVRDYIDAMHAFFNNEYDDCIRRVVTATENFIESKGWRIKPRSRFEKLLFRFPCLGNRKGDSFRRKLADNLNKSIISGQVINENLQYVYNIRNKVVHNGYRMKTSSGMFCDKAVCSLYYLIYRYSGSYEISNYVSTLNMQFLIHKSFLGELLNLDDIERNLAKNIVRERPINSNQYMEEFMFNSLRFNDEDKRLI